MDAELSQAHALVQDIYKGLLENFHPSTRNLIHSGKAFLKALHGSSAASSLYLDSLHRVAKEAASHKPSADCTTGGGGDTNDIGRSLMEMTEAFKELHHQQLATLKSFYVDFLLPLESNIGKDGRVLQAELKKYNVDVKHRQEAYAKAVSTVKKVKQRGGGNKRNQNLDREIRGLQGLEEERTRLECFIQQAAVDAENNWRRRYGFILERECSLAKHYMSYHSKGLSLIQPNLEKWMAVGADKLILSATDNNTINPIIVNKECRHCCNTDDDRKQNVGNKNKKKGKKGEATAIYTFNRQHHQIQQQDINDNHNQLAFNEGDIITFLGPIRKGWQYGENTRTKLAGWFPIAYVSKGGGAGGADGGGNGEEESTDHITSDVLKQRSEKKKPSLSMNGKGGKELIMLSSSNDSGISDKVHQAHPEVDYSEDDDDEDVEDNFSEERMSSTPALPVHIHNTTAAKDDHGGQEYRGRQNRQDPLTSVNTVGAAYTKTWLRHNLSRTQSFNSLTPPVSTIASNNKNDNKIKRIIQRTKSMIFNNKNRKQEEELDCWASHDSIVEVLGYDDHTLYNNAQEGTVNNATMYNDHGTVTTAKTQEEEDTSSVSVFSSIEEDYYAEEQGIVVENLPPPPPPPPMPLPSSANKSSCQPIVNNNNVSTTINQTIFFNNSAAAAHLEPFRKNTFSGGKICKPYQISERSGNFNGPWYDLWGEDGSSLMPTGGGGGYISDNAAASHR